MNERAAKLKVFGSIPDGRNRCIVAAPSLKAAAEAMGVAYRYLRAYGSQTFNVEEVGTAMAEPGIPFARHMNSTTPFIRLERGRHKPDAS